MNTTDMNVHILDLPIKVLLALWIVRRFSRRTAPSQLNPPLLKVATWNFLMSALVGIEPVDRTSRHNPLVRWAVKTYRDWYGKFCDEMDTISDFIGTGILVIYQNK